MTQTFEAEDARAAGRAAAARAAVVLPPEIEAGVAEQLAVLAAHWRRLRGEAA